MILVPSCDNSNLYCLFSDLIPHNMARLHGTRTAEAVPSDATQGFQRHSHVTFHHLSTEN